MIGPEVNPLHAHWINPAKGILCSIIADQTGSRYRVPLPHKGDGNVSAQNLDSIMVAKLAHGGVHRAGRVVSYCDAPTYVLEDSEGHRFSWRVDLTERANQVDEVNYWRARALEAEGRAVSVHQSGNIPEPDPRQRDLIERAGVNTAAL